MKLFAAFLIITCILYSNKDNTYTTIVTIAESEIIKENYSAALEQYEKAFDFYDLGWSNDYYNAFICAREINNEQAMFSYLDTLASKGYSLENLKYITPKNLQETNKWSQFINNFSSLNEQFHMRNCKIKNELDSLLSIDQKYAELSLTEDSSVGTYHSIVFSNGLRVFDLIKNDCLPKENLYSIESNEMCSPVPIVLLRHFFGLLNTISNSEDIKYTKEPYCNMKIKTSDFEEIICDKIAKGLLPPTLLLNTIDYLSRESYNKYFGAEFHLYKTNNTKGQGIRKLLSVEEENCVDSSRMNLNLCNAQENYIKINFNINRTKRDKFKFVTGATVKEFICPNQLIVDKTIEGAQKNNWVKVD